jgi:hypothetical protein
MNLTSLNLDGCLMIKAENFLPPLSPLHNSTIFEVNANYFNSLSDLLLFPAPPKAYRRVEVLLGGYQL